MPDVQSIDLVKLFENLPAERVHRSTEPQHTGFCWFKTNGAEDNGYPDTAKIQRYVESADQHGDDMGNANANANAEDADAEFEKAIASACFLITEGDDDGGDANSQGEQDANSVVIEWKPTFSDAPGGAVRRYLLETAVKDMVFTGSARMGSVVQLLELGTMFSVLGTLFDVDFNDLGSEGSQCRPWQYEFISADTSESLLTEAAACLQEHQDSQELWVACAHSTGTNMNFCLFSAEADDPDAVRNGPALTCALPVEGFLISQDSTRREFFRAIIFWRDADTDSTIPWS